VPSFSGSFGILPNHVPSLAVLRPGVVTVFENEGAVKKFFVSSGSVTINEDASVQILAEEAHPLEDLVFMIFDSIFKIFHTLKK
jgi:F-type H+-transporting ATPase subunit delta